MSGVIVQGRRRIAWLGDLAKNEHACLHETVMLCSRYGTLACSYWQHLVSPHLSPRDCISPQPLPVLVSVVSKSAIRVETCIFNKTKQETRHL